MSISKKQIVSIVLWLAAVLAPTAARANPFLSYYGGGFGGAVIVPVMMNNSNGFPVDSRVANNAQASLQRIFNSGGTNSSFLHNYDANGYSAATGYSVVAPVNIWTSLSGTISPSDVANTLIANFAQGQPLAGYAPWGDGLGIIYAVFLPPYTWWGSDGCGGSHSGALYNGTPFRFAWQNADPNKCVGNNTFYGGVTLSQFHEVIEAITDPWGTVVESQIYSPAWNGSGNSGFDNPNTHLICEIGDLCNNRPATVLGADGQRTMIQKTWQDNVGLCISGQIGSFVSGVSQAANSLSGYWTRMDGSISYSYNLNGGSFVDEVSIPSTVATFGLASLIDDCASIPGAQSIPVATFDGPVTPVSTFQDQSVKVFGADVHGNISEVRWDAGSCSGCSTDTWSGLKTIVNDNGTTPGTQVTAINSGLGDGSVWLVWPHMNGQTQTYDLEAVFVSYADDSTPLVKEFTGATLGMNLTSIAAVVTKPGNLWFFWANDNGKIAANGFDCAGSSCSPGVHGGGQWNGSQSIGVAQTGTPLSAMTVNGTTYVLTNYAGFVEMVSLVPALGTLSPSAQSTIYGPGGAGGGPYAAVGTPVAVMPFATHGAIFYTGSDGSIQRGTVDPQGAWSAVASLPLGGASVWSNTVLTATTTGPHAGGVLFQDALTASAVMLSSPTILGATSSYGTTWLSINYVNGPIR